MAAGSSTPQRSRKAYSRIRLWLQRNELKLLTIDAVCIALLSFIHLLPSTFQIFAQENVIAIQIAAAVLVSFIALSVVGKGPVPLIICALGIVLMHNSVILPYYAEPQTREVTFWGTTILLEEFTPTAVSMGTTMNFLLGASMVAFSIVIAYRPSLLFTRNRPESLDAEWAKYPVWHDNSLLADGRMDRSVPVKSLMTEQEQYLLWRYEYILASIYGTPHLVRPNGLVPEGSVLFRDKESGRVVGKARHTSFFT
jgi:hypothetical protein